MKKIALQLNVKRLKVLTPAATETVAGGISCMLGGSNEAEK